MTEKQLLERVGLLDQQLSNSRQRVSLLKKKLTEEETNLISCNIERERVLEELRIYRKEHYSKEITDRQIDIERFRKLLPEMLKKVE